MSDLIERLRREEPRKAFRGPLGQYQAELFHRAANRIEELENRIEKLEAEKKRLFDAHSVEMVRADALKQEVERLREKNIEMQEFLFPNDDCPEWMKEEGDD